MLGLCRASVWDSGLKGRFPGAQGAALGLGHTPNSFLGLKGRFQSECGCAVMLGVPGAYAPGSAEVGPSGLGAAVNVASGIARWTLVRGPKSVPEFTANAFDDHDWRMREVSICRPKSLNSLGCSGGKASQTPTFMGNDKG